MKRKINREELSRRIDGTGMKPFAFAKANGIVPESLRRWLNGQREPKIDNIRQIAEALHCDVDDISCLEIEVDFSKLDKVEFEVEEIRHLWGYLPPDQRISILNLIRTIAETNSRDNEDE